MSLTTIDQKLRLFMQDTIMEACLIFVMHYFKEICNSLFTVYMIVMYTTFGISGI